jgi:hypothetical protein
LFVCLLALAVSRFACVSAWPCDGTAGATLLGAAPHRQESEKKASAPDPIAKAEDNRAYRKLLQVLYIAVPCSLYSPVPRRREIQTHGLWHDRRQCEGLGGAGPVA